MAEHPSTKKPSTILTHAEADPPVVPLGGCIIYWTAATMKAVLAHVEAQQEKDKAGGVKPLGGCIIYWW